SGDWELVDFKSGAPAAEAAAIYRRQLALYTLAVRDTWRVPAERISAHLFFLQDGSDLALSFTNFDLDDLKQEVEAALLAIGRGEFPTRTESPLCGGCDYSHLCPSE
ncbi:MAG TPA: PD-(D/E)XK nuclease family protein, partial [Thermoleophilia bacterium]|nr:PD-(D/E)XK nuclease family protein [Thermoleophilia bacterium]